MATSTVARASHATLSTTTVDTVNLTDLLTRVNVINRTGTADLTVTWATGGAAANPVALAAETLLVPAGQSLTFAVGGSSSLQRTQVKVLGDGNGYSVQGLG